MRMVGLALLCALGACWSSAWAYDEITVTDGGSISGTVTMTGGKPTPKGYNLITFPDPVYCGRISTGTGWRILDEFSMGAGNGLKDVVVLLTDATKGKPFKFEPLTIEARDCRFLPFVTVVKDGSDVVVMNMDPVMHDIQGYETSPEAGARVLFNTPLILNHQHQRGNIRAIHNHAPGKSLVGPIYLNKGRRTFYMQCGFHAYMESWAMAVNNPYYAVTDDQGAFKIDNVPPGTYQMVVWHPQSGPGVTRTITVAPDGTTTEQVALPAPKGNRTAYRVMENPRFGLESLGHPVEIQPLVEHQH